MQLLLLAIRLYEYDSHFIMITNLLTYSLKHEFYTLVNIILRLQAVDFYVLLASSLTGLKVAITEFFLHTTMVLMQR